LRRWRTPPLAISDPGLIDGKPKALNVPAGLADEVREKIEVRRRFEAAAATIRDVNLKRFLKEKGDRPA
jgi:hypothetical protein